MIINYKGLRIFIFSDTHGYHHKLALPTNIDVIICAGDVVSGFSNTELEYFFKWYASIPAGLKIFVAGNHELIFDLFPQKAKSFIPNNIILLENSGITYKEVYFYSVVARAWLHYEIEIPENTDILITHGPPKGILDDHQGCALLRKAVFKSKPAYHLFGHIHSLGNHTKTIKNIRFCNVSCQNQIKQSKST